MRFIFIAPVLVLALSSCHFYPGERVAGNGHINSQQRNVGSFDGIDAAGQVKVHVMQNASPSVKIETDENLQQYLDVFTDGHTLIIRSKEGYNLDPSKDIVAYVSAPVFKEIALSGQCDIVGDSPITGTEPLNMHVSGQGDITLEVNLPKISTEISGQGNVKLKGQVTDFNAHVSGQGDVKCFDLITENTTVDISGGSDVEVTANKQLNIGVSGSGSIQYKGNASVNQNVSGSGSVKKVG